MIGCFVVTFRRGFKTVCMQVLVTLNFVVVLSRWEQLLEDSRTRKERLQHAQDQYKKVSVAWSYGVC